MNRHLRRLPCLATTTLIFGLAAAPLAAHAQTETGASDAAATPPADDGGIEEIVVTARKRSEQLRDVPLSIQVIGADQLVERKILQLPDLAASIPNFSVSFGTSSPFTFIRGFGSGTLLSFDQSVGKFVDNVSYGRDQDARLPLFDLERVEVLRGPQVLVFGNSATAGALNIVTKKPGDAFEADAALSNEFENQEMTLRAGVTLPISDSTSLRVAGFYQDLAEGWMSNPLSGRDEPLVNGYAGRATLRVAPSSELEILLKAEYDDMSTKGATMQPIRQPTNPLAQFTDATLDMSRSVNNDVAPFYQGEFSRVVSPTFQSDINYDALGGTFTSTSAYRELQSAVSLTNYSNLPLFSAFISERYNQFSQELRYSGTRGALDVTAGAYYEHSNLRSFTLQEFNLGIIGVPAARGGVPFGRLDLYDVKTDAWSVFADLTYHLTDTLSVAAGARYSDTGKRADQSSNPVNIVPGLDFDTTQADVIAAINPGLTAPFTSAARAVPHSFTGLELNEAHLQPQFVVQYAFLPEQMVYAKFVKGDKAGGFDANYGLATPPEPFDSERAESYELGIKGLTLGGTLNYALTAFRETFVDLQVSFFQSPVVIVSNVGKARSQGLELELSWAPLAGLSIGLDGAYLDAEYLSFPNASCTVDQVLATPSGTTCVQDRSGTPTQFSSEWTGALRVDYRRPILSGRYELGGGAGVFARSKYNPSRENDPLMEQDGYAQFDAHVDLRAGDERWSVSLYGKNLSDENYIEYATQPAALTGSAAVSLARGRQYGLMLGVKY